MLDRNHEIPHPEQTLTPRLLIGGWLTDQNTSHIKTRNDLARSVVISPDEVEEFDAIIQNVRKKLEIPGDPGEPLMPCVTQVRILTSKTPTRKVTVSKKAGGGVQH